MEKTDILARLQGLQADTWLSDKATELSGWMGELSAEEFMDYLMLAGPTIKQLGLLEEPAAGSPYYDEAFIYSLLAAQRAYQIQEAGEDGA